jgi:hypothetical protein
MREITWEPLFRSLQNKHDTIFVLFFIILQHVSAVYAGHRQVQIHKTIQEKDTLKWWPPFIV